MTASKFIYKVREVFPEQPLNDVQELVLKMCWEGKTYTEIAAISEYEESYLRDIGAKLWQKLSLKLNTKVSKHNLHVIFKMYLDNQPQLISDNLTDLAAKKKSVSQIDQDYLLKAQKIEAPGEILGLNSSYYCDRPECEELVFQELTKPGSMIKIKSPGKMGKSSLLIRVLERGIEQGFDTVFIDLKQVDLPDLKNINSFLFWLCRNVAYQLKQPLKTDAVWDLQLGAKVNCTLYFQNHILQLAEHRILIIFNDLEQLFQHPEIAEDFLSLLKFWHEQLQQNILWSKLNLLITCRTESYVADSINQLSLNFGLSITLPKFTIEQVKQLANKYKLYCDRQNLNHQTITNLYDLVGGHPYLIHLAFDTLTKYNLSWEEFLLLAPTEAGIYGQYLRNLANFVMDRRQLKQALIKLIIARTPVKITPQNAYQLEGLGIILRQGNLVELTCDLYRSYFRDLLIVKPN